MIKPSSHVHGTEIRVGSFLLGLVVALFSLCFAMEQSGYSQNANSDATGTAGGGTLNNQQGLKKAVDKWYESLAPKEGSWEEAVKKNADFLIKDGLKNGKTVGEIVIEIEGMTSDLISKEGTNATTDNNLVQLQTGVRPFEGNQ